MISEDEWRMYVKKTSTSKSLDGWEKGILMAMKDMSIWEEKDHVWIRCKNNSLFLIMLGKIIFVTMKFGILFYFFLTTKRNFS